MKPEQVARRIVMMFHEPKGPDYAAIENAIAAELSARDAEIEQLKQQRTAPRSRSKKQKIEDALRQSDLTAQLSGRTDIEYGHHETLPRGEHVANLRKR